LAQQVPEHPKIIPKPEGHINPKKKNLETLRRAKQRAAQKPRANAHEPMESQRRRKQERSRNAKVLCHSLA